MEPESPESRRKRDRFKDVFKLGKRKPEIKSLQPDDANALDRQRTQSVTAIVVEQEPDGLGELAKLRSDDKEDTTQLLAVATNDRSDPNKLLRLPSHEKSPVLLSPNLSTKSSKASFNIQPISDTDLELEARHSEETSEDHVDAQIQWEAWTLFRADPKYDSKALESELRFGDTKSLNDQTLRIMRTTLNKAKEEQMVVPLPFGKRLVVSELFEKVIDCIGQTAKPIDTAVQFDPVHAALPWAAVRLLLQGAVNYTNRKAVVWEGANQLCEDLVWVSHQQKIFLGSDTLVERDLQRALVGLFVQVFATVADFTKFLKQHTATNYFKSQFASESHYKQRLRDLSQARAQVERYSTQISGIRALETRKYLVEQSLHQHEEQRNKLLDWISSVRHVMHWRSIHERALEGTGEWIYATKEWQEWYGSKESQILRVRGNAGFGKSTLLSLVIASMQKSEHIPQPIYFFCERNEPQRAEPKSIFRCLLRQLLRRSSYDTIQQKVEQRYKQRDELDELEADEAIRFCKLIIENQDVTFIFLDALDEIHHDNHPVVLQVLVDFATKLEKPVKIFVTTRPSPVRHIFYDKGYDLDASRNRDDIRRYINHKLDKLIEGKELFHNAHRRRDRISETLDTKADGCFRWVDVQLRAIHRHEEESALFSALDRAPSGLIESYAMRYEFEMEQYRDEPEIKQIVIQTFKWLLIGHKRLHARDLCTLVGHVDESGQPKSIKGLQSYCFGLATYDKTLDKLTCHLSVREFFESAAFLDKHPEFDPKRMHTDAAKQCLELVTKGRKESWKPPSYSVLYWAHHASSAGGQSRVDSSLANDLRRILIDDTELFTTWADFAYGEDDDDWVWKSRNSGRLEKASLPTPHPLMVACRWNLHEILPELLAGKSVKSLEALKMGPRQFPLIHRTANWNALKAMEHLLRYGLNPDARDKADRTSLIKAAAKSEEDSVRLLLQNGASVNAAGKDGTTALIAAARKDRQAVVRILLEHGADVNKGARDGTTPLIASAKVGAHGTAQLLLSRRANPKTVSKEHGTALAAAIRGGHVSVVELLLDRKAHPHRAGEGDAEDLLDDAIQVGSCEIIETLFKRGFVRSWPKKTREIIQQSRASLADKNAMHKLYLTHEQLGLRKLCGEAYRGNIEHVKSILECGVEPNDCVANIKIANPLVAAILSGKTEIVKLLYNENLEIPLSIKAKVVQDGDTGLIDELNMNANDLSLPLYRATDELDDLRVAKLIFKMSSRNISAIAYEAAKNGALGVVKTLLAHNIGPEVYKANQKTPLEGAAKSGNLEIIKMLLDRGARLSAAAAWQAARNGSCEAVRLTLGKRIHVDTVSGDPTSTLLVAAVYSGRTETVEFLLEQGADVNKIGAGGEYNPLTAAVVTSRIDMIDLLLESGARINDIAGRTTPNTALSAAVLGYQFNVVAFLLKKGAAVNIPIKCTKGGAFGDRESVTALQMAAATSDRATIELLLTIDADLETSGPDMLILAATNGKEETVDYLLKRGFSANAANRHGNALVSAVRAGYTDIAKMLLKRGAEITSRQPGHQSAIEEAIDQPDISLLEAVLDCGARNGDDQEELLKQIEAGIRSASHRGRFDMVELLLKQGLSVRPEICTAVLVQAKAKRDAHAIKVLRSHGADTQKYAQAALVQAVTDGNVAQAARILVDGADINGTHPPYESALVTVAALGDDATARFLLDRGANANTADGPTGRTALVAATQAGHFDMLDTLLDNGADVNATTPRGTVLDLADQQAHSQGNEELLDRLLGRGAKFSEPYLCRLAARLDGVPELFGGDNDDDEVEEVPAPAEVPGFRWSLYGPVLI